MSDGTDDSVLIYKHKNIYIYYYIRSSVIPGVEEPGAQNHDGLASALLQLHLYGGELLVDDLHHALDLLRSDGASARLFSQQVHHVRREFVASLQTTNKLTLLEIRSQP